MEIVKFFEDSSIFLKSVTKLTENEAKEQGGRFLDMSLASLSASLLRNVFAGEGEILHPSPAEHPALGERLWGIPSVYQKSFNKLKL